MRKEELSVMNKRKKSKMGFLIAIVVVILFSRVMIEQQEKLRAKDLEMKEIQNKIDDMNKKNEELISQKELLNTDEYAEMIAREKLGMVKPGERVFVDVSK